MFVNNKTKSAEDLVKNTKAMSFMFYSREYMHHPETVKKLSCCGIFFAPLGFMVLGWKLSSIHGHLIGTAKSLVKESCLHVEVNCGNPL